VASSVALLGAHCGEPPSDGCNYEWLERQVARSSADFDASFPQSLSWVVTGRFVYAKGKGYPDAETGFTLRLRWSGEAYREVSTECAGEPPVFVAKDAPIVGEFATEDGAFDETFAGRGSREADPTILTFTLNPLAVEERRGTFALPVEAGNGFECQVPGLAPAAFHVATREPSLQTIPAGVMAPWLSWLCGPLSYPIGHLEVEALELATSE
jgi:hypothetical protein